jgi:hypothetical protein
MTTQAVNIPRGRPGLLVNAALLVTVVVLVALLPASLLHRAARSDAAMPHSAAMERVTGVRFSRVAVVGDGGLVTLFYVVLDPEKASAFQADRDHPPRLRSEARAAGTQRVSIMRNGHSMRPGATYYFVYDNAGQALRPGETVAISYRGVTLRGALVL